MAQLHTLISQVKGFVPYDEASFEAAKATLESVITDVVEVALEKSTYLTGEEITAGDYFAACVSAFPFTFLFDKEWISKHPVFVNWFDNVKSQPLIAEVFAGFTILDVAPTPAGK